MNVGAERPAGDLGDVRGMGTVPERPSWPSCDRELKRMAGLAWQIALGESGPAFAGALLRGRHIALISGAAPEQAAESFSTIDRLTRALGARTAWLQMETPIPDRSLQMLGRLYDGIYCSQSLAHLLPRIRAATDRPVFCGLLEPRHQTAMLALLLAVKERVQGDRSSVDLCLGSAGDADDASDAIRAARVLGLDIRVGRNDPGTPRTLRLTTSGLGFTAWQMGRCDGTQPDPAWLRRIARFHEAALQAALARTVP